MDESAVRARLLEYQTAMEAIKALADREVGGIAPKHWPAARQQMRELKDALESDYRPRSTVRGEENMTEAEDRFFYHVIAGAKSQINVKSNSRPDGQWLNELSDALVDINDGLWQMRKAASE